MLHVDCLNTKYGGEFKISEQVWHVRNCSFETSQAGTVFKRFYPHMRVKSNGTPIFLSKILQAEQSENRPR